MHRAACALAGLGEDAPKARELPEVALRCSQREREAADAERRAEAMREPREGLSVVLRLRSSQPSPALNVDFEAGVDSGARTPSTSRFSEPAEAEGS